MLAHALVHLRQVEHVLRSVLKEVLREWPRLVMPEIRVLTHEFAYLIFLSVLSLRTQVVEKQVIQTDLLVLKLLAAKCGCLQGLLQNPVCDLGIEHLLTLNAVELEEGGTVLTKVMENLDYFGALQNCF